MNGREFGHPNAATDLTFDFGQLIAHAAKHGISKPARSWVRVPSPIATPGVGCSCVAERRVRETIDNGKPVTPFMSFGDRIRIEMFDGAGQSIFVRHRPESRALPATPGVSRAKVTAEAVMKLIGYLLVGGVSRAHCAELQGPQGEHASRHLRKGEQAAPDYVALNPQKLVPARARISGEVLTQSLAILEYLEETHPEPPLLPRDPVGRARVPLCR